jgi:multiple sugar transport system substrate-binding protein
MKTIQMHRLILLVVVLVTATASVGCGTGGNQGQEQDLPSGLEVRNQVDQGKDQMQAKPVTLKFAMRSNFLADGELEKGLNWDLAEYPSFKELPNIGQRVNEWTLLIPKQSKYKDEAFQVIATILSDDVQLEMSRNARLPVLTGKQVEQQFGANLPNLQGKHLQSAFKSQPASVYQPSRYDEFAKKTIQQAMNSVIEGKKDINTALRESEEAINKNIAETKAGQ